MNEAQAECLNIGADDDDYDNDDDMMKIRHCHQISIRRGPLQQYSYMWN